MGHVRWRLPTLLLLTAFSVACGPEEPATPQPVETLFTLRVGAQELSAWVAVEEAEQQRGLMYRESLPPNTGMLFVFRTAERRAFWMRNTSLPLDIGYFAADGTLRSVHALYPFNEQSVPSASADIQFALEMTRGWYAAHGLGPGQKLDLATVRAALQARGFDPERYLLAAREN